MDYFDYKNGWAQCEEVSLAEVAEKYGTPTYVYSKATLKRHCQKLVEAFSIYPTLPCFAVKANSNLSYLREIFSSGLGADLVSLGELERCVKAGVDPKKIVFSGVGKSDQEIRRGLDVGILSFNVESRFELERIAEIAEEAGSVARVCLRINPNIDAKTNPKISTGLHSTKFGISEKEAEELFDWILKSTRVQLVGIACHIGSQITDIAPLDEAAHRMSRLAVSLRQQGHELEVINMGGGLGIRYQNEAPPSLEAYAKTLVSRVKDTGLKLVIEPGRVIAGNTGILLTRAYGLKETPEKKFLVVDASMTELVRPAFYGSFHEILPVKQCSSNLQKMDVVGPVCESSDVLGEDRELPVAERGDLFFFRGCGGYGATMASNYNSRTRPAEVMVDGKKMTLVKRRENLEDLWSHEI